jgi:uncharacterized protein (DUF302 family)
MIRGIILLLASMSLSAAPAGMPGVYEWRVDADLETVYEKVYNSLEKNRFFVVFEPDIGRNLAAFAERWGDDYNRNALTGIRSMVFCNAWYANQVSNLEPRLLALCPLHLTLYQMADTTHVVFARPMVLANDTLAAELVTELEVDVVKAVQEGIDALAGRRSVQPPQR